MSHRTNASASLSTTPPHGKACLSTLDPPLAFPLYPYLMLIGVACLVLLDKRKLLIRLADNLAYRRMTAICQRWTGVVYPAN